ncbi:MAG: hypothetical protein NVS4B11_09600 [Ktedonobacteraceae bacterium]
MLRAALDDLAALAPEWFERDSHRAQNSRLPKAETQRSSVAQQNRVLKGVAYPAFRAVQKSPNDTV